MEKQATDQEHTVNEVKNDTHGKSFGSLSRYANPTLLDQESSAFEKAVLEKQMMTE